jgi:hypothetical protein
MAVVNTNGTLMRWLNGGTLTITGAADTHPILNIHEGALSWKGVMRERIHYKDRGVHQQPLEGDDTLGELSVEVNCGALAGSTSLHTLLSVEDATSAHVAKEYASFIMDFPDTRGASAGQRVTFSNVSIDPSPQWTKGEDYDKLSFTAKFRSFTIATY